MTDGDSVAQLAVVILLLVLAVPSLATAHEYAGTPIKYEQSATIDFSSDTAVDESATVEGYEEEIVVRTSEGDILQEYDAYRWDEEGGAVAWLNSTNTRDGQSVTIEYAAHQRTEETELAWTVISPFFALFGLFTLVVSIRTLWSYIAEVFE
jgi:hypothetical protein